MNAYISKISRARATKFSDMMSYYCTQINIELKSSHAFLKQKKINCQRNFKAVILKFYIHNYDYHLNVFNNFNCSY